jgi:FimV-like protein
VRKTQLYWASVFYCTGLILPIPALALGLGDITVLSPHGMPFSAQIPVFAAHKSTLKNLVVHFVSPAQLKLAGLSKDATPVHWKISVQYGKHPSIHISSPVPITTLTPFLLKVEWDSGSLVKEYKVNNAATVTPLFTPKPRNTQIPFVNTSLQHNQKHKYYGWSVVDQYGPVPVGSSIAQIVRTINLDPHLNVAQVVNGLVHANPAAFRNGNPNMLYSGSMLAIPSLRQIKAEPSTLKNVSVVVKKVAPVLKKQAHLKNKVQKHLISKHSTQSAKLILSSAPPVVQKHKTVAKIGKTVAVPNQLSVQPTSKVQITPKNTKEELILTSSIAKMKAQISEINAQLTTNASTIKNIQSRPSVVKSGDGLELGSIGGNILLLLLLLYLYRKQTKLIKSQTQTIEKLENEELNPAPSAFVAVVSHSDNVATPSQAVEETDTRVSMADNITAMFSDFEHLDIPVATKKEGSPEVDTQSVVAQVDTRSIPAEQPTEQPVVIVMDDYPETTYNDAEHKDAPQDNYLDYSESSHPRIAVEAIPDVVETNGIGFVEDDVDTEHTLRVDPAIINTDPVMDAGIGSWDACGTKLDLARAYVEMGDTDAAKEMLNDLLLDACSATQRENAQQLLESIQA